MTDCAGGQRGLDLGDCSLPEVKLVFFVFDRLRPDHRVGLGGREGAGQKVDVAAI